MPVGHVLHARIDRVVYVSDPCISMIVCVAEGVVGESPSLCVSSFSFDKYSHSPVFVAWLKAIRFQNVLHCWFSAISRFVKVAGLIAVAAAIRDSE